MRAADAYPFVTRPAPLRFAMALGAVAIVYATNQLFGNVIDDASHLLLLAMAVMATAWFAGTGPAIGATVAGAVMGALDPPASPLDARAAQAHLVLFVLQGLLLTTLVSELRRARRVAEQQMHEAQQARRESEAAGRMKDEFLAIVSHELRTPLNAVLGWMHLLRTGKLDAQTTVRGLESIERNVRLQAQITGELLDVSKLLTGKLRLDSRPVSLGDSARQAVMAAVPAAQAKGVHVSSTIPDDAPTVLGDPTRLRQIVWHLLANAVKFTPRGGAVRLTLDTPGSADRATLTVSDSGPGIDPHFLPRVFERFSQEDASPTRQAGGLGVGLSLVRDLVELHGGEIEVGNRPDGAGAVFTVRLPIHTAASATTPVPVPELPDASSAPLDGLRVLVFDQDAAGRELVRTVLQQRGALVRMVDSVADALEALESWRPDVLVSDSAASEHESYALMGKVRTLEPARGGRIPAAALTSFGRTDDRVRQMLEPAQRHVPKPIEPAKLTAEVARLAGRERRRAQRY